MRLFPFLVALLFSCSTVCAFMLPSTAPNAIVSRSKSSVLMASEEDIVAAYQKKKNVADAYQKTKEKTSAWDVFSKKPDTTAPADLPPVDVPAVDVPSVDVPPVVVEPPPVNIVTESPLKQTTVQLKPLISFENRAAVDMHGERVPSFFEYLKDLFAKTPDIEAVKAQAGTLKQNLDGIVSTGVSTGMEVKKQLAEVATASPDEKLAKVSAAGAAATASAGAVIFSNQGVQQFMDKVVEYGPWCVAGGIFCLWQVQVSRQRDSFQEKLQEAERKAKEAAEAATLAAEGATVAKKLSVKRKSTEVVLSKSELEAMELEKESMAEELKQLRKETEELKQQIKVLAKGVDMPVTEVNGVEKTPVARARSVTRQILDRDPGRLLDVLDGTNTTDTAAAADNMTVTATATKTKVVPRRTISIRKAAAPAGTGVAEKAKVEPKKKTVQNKAATPKKPRAKAAPKAADSANPWASLSPSTLKRKTVKELSSYLTERGVKVTDEEGKPLKKAVLVDAVMNP